MMRRMFMRVSAAIRISRTKMLGGTRGNKNEYKAKQKQISSFHNNG